jgi:hypothetical protein
MSYGDALRDLVDWMFCAHKWKRTRNYQSMRNPHLVKEIFICEKCGLDSLRVVRRDQPPLGPSREG